MKLIVLGGTGATGRELVDLALREGHDVTAYGRRTGSLPVDHPRLRTVTGDVSDAAALTETVRGGDAVVSTLGPSRGPGTLRGNTLIDTSTEALVSAAQDTGVSRVVVLSAFGVGESLRKASAVAQLVYRTLLADAFRDKVRGEARLTSSALDWTLAYPVTLTNQPPAGSYAATPLAETGRLPGLPRIARADVADFLLRAATSDAHSRETVVLSPARRR